MNELEKRIGYTFKRVENYETAITHISYVEEKKLPRCMCNERLEFLGDAILGAIIVEYLFSTLREDEEGTMTKIKSDIVRSSSLAQIGRNINLGRYMRLGNGELKTGGRNKDSILENAVEALIGAIFIESGYDKTKEIILKIFNEQIELGIAGKLNKDYKSKFQEKLMKKNIDVSSIHYVIIEESGEEHNKLFKVAVHVGDEFYGVGQGKSKKEAETYAAKDAMSKMGEAVSG
ncbi:MAG: ribonuclease III [Eubacteriales bacterium]|nr:ribonuclease III [Eubacteriales bacterium]MDY3332398.1 ribonuclease III [Gallibacter sp.]